MPQKKIQEKLRRHRNSVGFVEDMLLAEIHVFLELWFDTQKCPSEYGIF